MTVEIRVPNLDCEGCASKLKKTLMKLKGIQSFFFFVYSKYDCLTKKKRLLNTDFGSVLIDSCFVSPILRMLLT